MRRAAAVRLERSRTCDWGSLWKRVGPQNSLHFGSRAHNNPNGLSGIVTQAPFEIGLHSGWRQPALKDDVAARDVSLYARKPGIATHALELRHWKLACPAYIHSAHESNVFGHVSSMSLARRGKGTTRRTRPFCGCGDLNPIIPASAPPRLQSRSAPNENLGWSRLYRLPPAAE